MSAESDEGEHEDAPGGGEDGRVRFTTSSESQSGACWLREAPSCTTLAVRHASPRHSRCASCVKLSHDYQGAGAIWFDIGNT